MPENETPINDIALLEAVVIFEIKLLFTVFSPLLMSMPRTKPEKVELEIKFEIMFELTMFLAPLT